jgi:hypothetical protein
MPTCRKVRWMRQSSKARCGQQRQSPQPALQSVGFFYARFSTHGAIYSNLQPYFLIAKQGI